MRVLMTGGGTGGHVNPALAIANTIMENDPKAEIAFVGTPMGIENKLVPKAGYHLYHVDVKGIKRSLSPDNIKSLYLAVTSPLKAKKIIKEFRPDIVIGTGGYVSWPVVKAASDMGIATALHESNAVAGMTVKMLSGVVDRVYLNFQEAEKGLKKPEKVMKVGCPMLSKFSAITKEEARAHLGIPESVKCYVLSFGGSLGAEKVNDAVLYLMEKYTGGNKDIFHTHATGAIEKEAAKKAFAEKGLDKYENLQLLEYIYDMPYRMAAADIVICRSGAMTVSEIALAGKCAIFIPSPNVTDDQQYKNARVLEEKNAAIIIRENSETGKSLVNTVKRLAEDNELRSETEKKAKEQAEPNANKKIYKDICELVKAKAK